MICKRHKLPEPCWKCQRDLATCKRKIRFSSIEEADEWVAEYNESHNYEETVTRYRCWYCKFWHMTKPTKKHQKRRVERMRRKWVIYMNSL